ncbi:MAG: hypothetical protein ABIP06_09585 [Pyrinomonadaceae bacterium]
MKKRHIKEILDRFDFSQIPEPDLPAIHSHITLCDDCRRSFRAAELTSSMLKKAAFETPVPSPFFQAKVLIAWREKQNLQKAAAGFRRWWQAIVAPVSVMVLTVFCLVGVSVFAPVSESDDSQARQSNDYLYTTEAVILNQKTGSDLTTEQVFRVLDAQRNGSVKTNGQRK